MLALQIARFTAPDGYDDVLARPALGRFIPDNSIVLVKLYEVGKAYQTMEP